ncbi:MAG TPA: outer membrane beta-barrel protein [Longimicrobiaceae bacterium]|nr:outer membrane beta-barrel protein [Longimicrobiaceae bacterium]
MKRSLYLTLIPLAIAAAAAPASAQQGFALKGHYIFNESTADDASTDNIPVEDGIGAGVEYVFPFGLGVGVSAYTGEGVDEFDVETTEVTVLGEANYFLSIPILPVSPYVGVHAGVGNFDREALESNPEFELQDDSRTQLGWQIGVRFQPIPLLGIDAQYRRMSTSAAEGQDEGLERNQFLVGITLF